MGMKSYEALVSKVLYFLLSTAILAMLGVFSFISSTVPLAKSHSTLLASTYEHVVMAKSTRMLVFILFHIITVMICYGSSSSKTPFDSEVELEGLLSVTPQVHELEKKEEVEACAYGDKCDEGEGGGGFRGEEEEDGCDEEIDDVWDDGDDEYFDSDDDEESHGDLRGRIEEFIGRVNRTWKEELLKEKKLLCLVEDTESLYMLVPYEMV